MSVIQLLESRQRLVEISTKLKRRAAYAASEDVKLGQRELRAFSDPIVSKLSQNSRVKAVFAKRRDEAQARVDKRLGQVLKFTKSADRAESKQYANYGIAKLLRPAQRKSSWRNNNPAPQSSILGKALGAAALGVAGYGAHRAGKYLHGKYKQWRGKESALLETSRRISRSKKSSPTPKMGPKTGKWEAGLGALGGIAGGLFGAARPDYVPGLIVKGINSRIARANAKGNFRAAKAYHRYGQPAANAASVLSYIAGPSIGAGLGLKLGGFAGRQVDRGVRVANRVKDWGQRTGVTNMAKKVLKTGAKAAVAGAGLYGLSKLAGKARDKMRGYSVKGDTIHTSNFRRRS